MDRWRNEGIKRTDMCLGKGWRDGGMERTGMYLGKGWRDGGWVDEELLPSTLQLTTQDMLLILTLFTGTWYGW